VSTSAADVAGELAAAAISAAADGNAVNAVAGAGGDAASVAVPGRRACSASVTAQAAPAAEPAQSVSQSVSHSRSHTHTLRDAPIMYPYTEIHP